MQTRDRRGPGEGAIIHSRVGTNGSLRLTTSKPQAIGSDCGDITVAFYIFNVCQLLGRACSLRKMGIGAP